MLLKGWQALDEDELITLALRHGIACHGAGTGRTPRSQTLPAQQLHLKEMADQMSRDVKLAMQSPGPTNPEPASEVWFGTLPCTLHISRHFIMHVCELMHVCNLLCG